LDGGLLHVFIEFWLLVAIEEINDIVEALESLRGFLWLFDIEIAVLFASGFVKALLF
jgi:hypothetical protein